MVSLLSDGGRVAFLLDGRLHMDGAYDAVHCDDNHTRS